jgi:hypothetical protein
MFRVALSIAAMVTCMSGGAAAQRSATPGGQPQQNAAGADRITLRGCIERADQLTPAGSAVGTTVDSQQFVLIKARAAESSDTTRTTTATGTSGVSGSAAASKESRAVGSMYRLDADASKLNPHVGHEVEVVGTSTGSAGTADAANPSAATAPHFSIESIKMLSETCPK